MNNTGYRFRFADDPPVLHGGRTSARVALRACLRTAAPLVGAGIDRIVHGRYVDRLRPLELAPVQKSALARSDPGRPRPVWICSDNEFGPRATAGTKLNYHIRSLSKEVLVSSMPTSPEIRPILTVAGVTVSFFSGSSAFFFKAGMAIDADGAPTAYHPVHGKGLDHLANAGHPGNWYGIVTDTGHKDGKPVIQGPNDPAPGFYVSPTALQNRHLPRMDPNRYVDSTGIPYISLPGHHGEVLQAVLGDLAMVINGHSGRRSAAIYADVGPRAKIGEGSIALARALGLNDNARHGGTESRSIIYIVFPHSGHGRPLPASAIDAQGRQLFESWGGLGRTSACFPEFAAHLR